MSHLSPHAIEMLLLFVNTRERWDSDFNTNPTYAAELVQAGFLTDLGGETDAQHKYVFTPDRGRQAYIMLFDQALFNKNIYGARR